MKEKLLASLFYILPRPVANPNLRLHQVCPDGESGGWLDGQRHLARGKDHPDKLGGVWYAVTLVIVTSCGKYVAQSGAVQLDRGPPRKAA